MLSVFEPSFQQFIALRDARARDQLAPLWQQLKADHPEWTFCSSSRPPSPTLASDGTKQFYQQLEQGADMSQLYFDSGVTRGMFPHEYILGGGSPFFIMRAKSKDGESGQQAVNLIWMHEWSGNSVGVGAGGAMMTLLDDVCGGLALYFSKTHCATKSMGFEFLRPLRPVPGMARAEARVLSYDRDKREIVLKASLFDGRGQECARALGKFTPKPTVDGGLKPTAKM
jgi:acyl-coenzyme A thioesterase PaaI-like protein